MINPTPFWPSLEPWATLTPVQVTMSTARIHQGGGSSPLGAMSILGSLTIAFKKRYKLPASTKPIMGEISNDSPTSSAFCQLTPAVREWL